MRPTPPGTLVLPALGAGLLAYLLVRRYYGDLPMLPWLPLATLLLLAVAEGVTARATAARIARKPGTMPVEPLVVARLVALAKASALVGALLAGGYGGAFSYVFLQRDRLSAAGHDSIVSAAGVVVSVLLVSAALWLEHSCRAPKPPDENEHLRQRA